ncbi:MAG: tetratricopeptide repeat protein [Acidobacteriota bacterium]
MVSVAARKKRKNTPIGVSKPGEKLVARVWSRSVYIACGALLVVVFLCYANALPNGFVFDDHVNLRNNPLLRKIENVPELLISGFRPLREVSYALDFALWGERPFGFHLTNIFIHAANTILVFLLIRRLIGDVLSSAIGALVFAIHPIQPDAVTYISGRRDILFAFFYLASFHSYLAYRNVVRGQDRPHRRRSALSYFALFLVLWAFGLMSKEMAATLPLVIFLWNFCDAWDKNLSSWGRRFLRAAREAFSRDKWLYTILSLAVPAYAWYVVFVKGTSVRTLTGFNYWGGSFYTNLLTVIRVHAWYLKQLVYPTPIVQYYGAFDISTSLLESRVILAILVVGAVIIAGFVLLNRNRLMAFAILSYFVLLLPVSQIIPHHELLADHYLYISLMSFGLFVAVLVQKLSAKAELVRRITYCTSGVILAVLMVMTFSRNRVYKNDLTLWQANYAEVPNSIRALFNLGSAYNDSYPARAGELYKRCIALDPSYAPAYVRLAMLYQIKDKAREAEELIKQGLTVPAHKVNAPGFSHPLRSRSDLTTALAISKGFQGLHKEAEDLLLEAINIYPANSQAYDLLAGYYHTADRAKELELLKRQIAVFSSAYYPLQTLTTRLIEDKRYDDALPYLDRMLTIVPNDFYANYQLGQIYLRTKKDCGSASRYLTTAKPAASGPDDTKAIDDALIKLQEQCGGS